MLNAGFRGDFVAVRAWARSFSSSSPIDIKFRKHRHRLLASTYLDPVASRSARARHGPGFMPDEIAPKLAGAELIGAGEIDGPEDVLLDADGNLYCGTRDGQHHAFAAPDHTEVRRSRENRRPAARPCASIAEGRIVACVAGMGLVRVTLARRGRAADRPDRAQPVQHPGRHDDPDGRRSRHRPGRHDLFFRCDQALRHRRLGSRSAGGPAERPASELRPEVPARRGRYATT